MKYLESFLKSGNQSSSTKNDTAGNNQASVLLVRDKRFSPGSEIDKKDCKQSTDSQYMAQKSANVHNGNAPITELDRHTDNNLHNLNFAKCVTPQPTVPTPEAEKGSPGINIEPIISSYPQLPSRKTLGWVLQAVMVASDSNQAKWFRLLEQWAADFHDRSWANEVIARLVQGEIEENQLVLRKDFDIATQMFGGSCSRIISNAEVTNNNATKRG